MAKTPIRAAEIMAINELPIAEIRALANSQIDKAQQLFDKVSDSSSYSNGMGVSNLFYWDPSKDAIKAARDSLSNGDKLDQDNDKKYAYVASWTRGRQAVDIIYKAGTNKPNDIQEFIVTPIEEKAQEVAAVVKKAAAVVQEGASNIAITLGIVFILSSQLKSYALTRAGNGKMV